MIILFQNKSTQCSVEKKKKHKEKKLPILWDLHPIPHTLFVHHYQKFTIQLHKGFVFNPNPLTVISHTYCI